MSTIATTTSSTTNKVVPADQVKKQDIIKAYKNTSERKVRETYLAVVMEFTGCDRKTAGNRKTISQQMANEVYTRLNNL